MQAPRHSTSSEFKLTPNGRVLFQKSSGHVIVVHNKASGVLTLCGHNPKLSVFVIGT
jgi:hypothetical protein